ncbi:MAG TPA: pyridoxamine 5'-phosphate oxidase [Acidimicrobiales bacterium]|nr:pyridoxamine 5'-phosphate oxidase [Acidimicrobiales bacterium]
MTPPAADAPGADPLSVFARWRREADGVLGDADAIALATATPDGRPSVRMVLMRGITDAGVRFFTNYESRKGTELASNPRAAIVWFDSVHRRQVRVDGTVSELAAGESDAYFASRDRGHQLGAVASQQSSVLVDRTALERAYAVVEARFAGREVERPARWGGYLLTASDVELWLQRDDRLHDRFAYRRESSTWVVDRLAP